MCPNVSGMCGGPGSHGGLSRPLARELPRALPVDVRGGPVRASCTRS